MAQGTDSRDRRAHSRSNYRPSIDCHHGRRGRNLDAGLRPLLTIRPMRAMPRHGPEPRGLVHSPTWPDHDQAEGRREAARLSPRERELVALVAGGLTDAQIAQRLVISVRTVRSHLDRIRDKSGARRRAELTRLAATLGVIPQ